MKKDIAKFSFIGLLFAAVIAGVFMIQKWERMEKIAATLDAYRLEAAVWRERAENDLIRKELSIEEVINPDYRKKFDLGKEKYMNEKGYFSPTRRHWMTWSITTKSAAIAMWTDQQAKLTAYQVDYLIQRIDSYYKIN